MKIRLIKIDEIFFKDKQKQALLINAYIEKRITKSEDINVLL
jgi:hypothetical protein